VTETEYNDLLEQQQRDRRLLLAYAGRIDQQADQIAEQAQRITHFEAERTSLQEKLAQQAAQLAEVQARRDSELEQLSALRAEQVALRTGFLDQQAAHLAELQARRDSELEQFAVLRAELAGVRTNLLNQQAMLFAELQARRDGDLEQLTGLRAEHEAFRTILLKQQAEVRRRYEEEVGRLRDWQEGMMRSRTYRLLVLYRSLYQAPLIGAPLRLIRRFVSLLRRGPRWGSGSNPSSGQGAPPTA